MNPRFQEYRKAITNPVKYRLFLLGNLPLAFFAGVKVDALSGEAARITIPQRWFNKNPFRSIYLGMLTMAAEISTGILCMGAVYKRQPSVSLLPVNMQAVFHKKATGTITFTCSDGAIIHAAVEEAIATGESRTVSCHSTGRNKAGELVAEFTFSWSFKARVSM